MASEPVAPRTIVSGNTIHNEEIGIDAMYRLGFFETAPSADWLRVEDNQVFGNLEVGIRLQENVLVTNNVVHGQRGYGGGSRGISSFSAGTIANNQVYDNDFGVFAESDTLVENNDSYLNAVGVYLDREGQAIGNRIHSNDVGIRTDRMVSRRDRITSRSRPDDDRRRTERFPRARASRIQHDCRVRG
ncbi:MAG: right-handed parallel beta-helix repeat-containing protein [Pirellulaceae bacterium]